MSILNPHINEIATVERDLLIIDDNEMLVRSISRSLRKMFRSVSTAFDFDNAQNELKKLSPHGFILSDLDLKSDIRINEGLYLAEITLSTRRKTGQLFLLQSGGASDKTALKIANALDSGLIDGFIEKSYSPADLKEKIQQIIGHQFPFVVQQSR